MNHGDGAGAVGMGVCVVVRGASMRRPARVAHAHGTVHRLFPDQRRKLGHLADSSADLETGAVQDRDTGGVVASILDAAEPVEKNLTGLPV